MISHHNLNDESSLAKIKGQYAFLQNFENENGTPLMEFNKKKLMDLMKALDKKGILVGKEMSDFNFVHPKDGKTNTEVEMNLVEEKKTGKNMLMRKQTIPYEKKLSFFKEIEILSSLNHQNILNFQEIFFQFQEKTFTVHFLYYNCKITNFCSWLTKQAGADTLNYHGGLSFQSCKRNLPTIRKFLLEMIKGIQYLHNNKIIHLGLSLGALFIDEDSNECLISGLGLDYDFHKMISQNSWQHAPETTSYHTTRLLSSLSEIDELKIIEKNDIFTDKKDIFDLGKILYFIFVDENEKSLDLQGVNEETIEKKLNSCFGIEKESFIVCKNTIRDLKKIILSCLSENQSERFNVNELIENYGFFKREVNIVDSFDDIFLQALRFDQGDGINRDYLKARIILENLSKRKHPPSSYYLGLYLTNGIGKKDETLGKMLIKQNARKTREFVEKAFKNDDKYYLFFQGLFYDLGDAGFPMDSDKAIEFYKKAANLGHSSAYCNLAVKFVSKSNKSKEAKAKENSQFETQEAFQNCQISAELGDVSGIFNLGCLYARGTDSHSDHERDFHRAFELYEQAYQLGSTTAAFQLGVMVRSGLGVPQDLEKAVEYMELAAERGETVAQLRLGYMFESGDEILQNFQKAFKYYEMAAKNGSPESSFLISEFYSNGLQEIPAGNNEIDRNSFKKNFEKRIHYLKLAAKKKSNHIMKRLGETFEHGELGSGSSHFKIETDFPLAFNFYRQGSLTDPDSVFGMRQMIEDNGKFEDCQENKFHIEFKDDTFNFSEDY